MVNRKRDMFQPLNGTNSSTVNPKDLVQQNGTSLLPKNVLTMNPLHIKSLIWPEVHMPNEELTVSLKSNFYSIKDSRNKQRFIDRNSMPDSQVIHFSASKNRDKLTICSVEKVIIQNKQKTDELWYHFDIAIFNVQTEEVEKL